MYNTHMEKCVVCMGAVNVDITATTQCSMVLGDSNMGTVRVHAGGVARNVAENIARLGGAVKLMSCVGMDMYGDMVLTHTKNAGVDVALCGHIPHMATSIYVPIIDSSGEMVVAVNDMGIMACIDKAFVQHRDSVVQSATALCMDTGMDADTLHYICNTYAHIPIFVDTVSCVKAPRIIDSLPHIHTLKANKAEAEIVSGVPIATTSDMPHASHILHTKGVQNVYITLGAGGTYASSVQTGQQHSLYCPAYKGNIVNVTGAGDAYMAGLVYAYIQGYDIAAAVDIAQAMAVLTAQTAQTVHPHMAIATVTEYIINHTTE